MMPLLPSVASMLHEQPAVLRSVAASPRRWHAAAFHVHLFVVMGRSGNGFHSHGAVCEPISELR